MRGDRDFEANNNLKEMQDKREENGRTRNEKKENKEKASVD